MFPNSTSFRALARKADLALRYLKFRLIASPLNWSRPPTLDVSLFTGKRVVILGPAQTVIDDLSGISVDSYDVVVRLNGGISLALDNGPWLGSRTDVLFHNLTEDGERSAGKIHVSLLQLHSVKHLVFPHWAFKGSKARLYNKKRELERAHMKLLFVPPRKFCEDTRKALGGKQPTVGASAILFFLQSKAEEVAIHGFTFFQSPYLQGYNDTIRTAEQARTWAEASAVHDPNQEKILVRTAVSQARQRGIKVSLGPNVERFLYDRG